MNESECKRCKQEENVNKRIPHPFQPDDGSNRVYWAFQEAESIYKIYSHPNKKLFNKLIVELQQRLGTLHPVFH